MDLQARIRAAVIHLALSAGIAGIAAGLVFLLWYPWPYTALAGGIGLFILITCVDVVLGPSLTLVVFDRRKSLTELRRDLAVIVALQVAALGYGLHTMFEARPVVLALEIDRLRVVSANDVLTSELPLAPPGLQRLPLGGPRLIRTQAPTDPKERLAAIDMALAGADLGARPKYWRNWDAEAARQVRTAGRPLDELRRRRPELAAELDAAIRLTGYESSELRFLPILSRHADWVALVNARSGQIVGYVPFSIL
jgi:hypothetical protein